MFSKRSVPVILLVFFTLLVGSSVLADDGRINPPPYHFGGDTLYCNQETGCTLLNKEGHYLANWPQSDIATALATVDSTGQNTKVNGKGQGTYGPMQLWAVSRDATTGNNTLCMIGFDEWGKQNVMCFHVTKDWNYQPAPLPVTEVDHSCDAFRVGQFVQLISDSETNGEITSINLGDHTVTFSAGVGIVIPVSHTAKCSEVEVSTPT